MRRHISMLLLFALLVSAMAAVPTSAQAQGTNPLASIPVIGSAVNSLGQIVTFAGQFTVQQFAIVNGTLSAVGTLTGTLTNTVTQVTQAVNQAVVIPVNLLQTTGSCSILHLVLGPIDLNLLGLVVHTNQIHVDITAQAGPGNLLGNLLCAVAHLLDNGGPLAGLVVLLNNILHQLVIAVPL